jgi:hypothetical protein
MIANRSDCTYIRIMKTALRHPVTVRLDPKVLSAAKAKAADDNRTLTNYIETLLRRDLRLVPGAAVQVIAPSDIRDYEPARLPGESRKRRAFRRRLFTAILDKGGY